MFDVAWQELLVVGIVALIVVGPKELPTLLRTVGKYVGAIKRQASEFRAQFDEAMRETELEQLRRDVESIKTDAEARIKEVERTVDSEISAVKTQLDETAQSMSGARHPDAHDADGLPMTTADDKTPPPAPVEAAGSAAVAAAAAAAVPATSDPKKVDA